MVGQNGNVSFSFKVYLVASSSTLLKLYLRRSVWAAVIAWAKCLLFLLQFCAQIENLKTSLFPFDLLLAVLAAD